MKRKVVAECKGRKSDEQISRGSSSIQRKRNEKDLEEGKTKKKNNNKKTTNNGK